MTSYIVPTLATPVRMPLNVKIVHDLLIFYANVCFFNFVVINLICEKPPELLFN